MAFITPKTDWIAENNINFSDFNRIEHNINALRSYLISIAYIIPALTVVTNRDNTAIPFLSEINRIERNIRRIQENTFLPIGFQDTKIWAINQKFTFEDANRLERSIVQLKETGEKAYENFTYCNTFSVGETAVIY